MNRRRIFDSFRQARRSEADPEDWMPLAEAATTVRAAHRDTDLDRMSRGLGENEESLLAFWAHRVAQIGVPVYGSRIMATMPEVIPDALLQAGTIRDGATRLETVRGEPIKDFGALQVKRRDLEDAIARIGTDPERPI